MTPQYLDVCSVRRKNYDSVFDLPFLSLHRCISLLDQQAYVTALLVLIALRRMSEGFAT